MNETCTYKYTVHLISTADIISDEITSDRLVDLRILHQIEIYILLTYKFNERTFFSEIRSRNILKERMSYCSLFYAAYLHFPFVFDLFHSFLINEIFRKSQSSYQSSTLTLFSICQNFC